MKIQCETSAVEYFQRHVAINAERDITLLVSPNYRGLLTIGTDNKLYAFSEVYGGTARFSRTVLKNDVTQFAAEKISGSDKFIVGVISGGGVYAAVTADPTKNLPFSKVAMPDGLIPFDLFATSLNRQSTILILLRDASGRVRQEALVCDGTGTTIKSYNLAVDFTAIQQCACGRANRQIVDGVYEYGDYSGTKQFLYTPSYNAFGDAPPQPVRLKTPDKGIDAMNTCKISSGTHVVYASGDELYVHPYGKQADFVRDATALPTLALKDACVNDSERIVSYISEKVMYVWFLNKSADLYYAFSAVDANENAVQFSRPLKFADGVNFFDASESAVVYSTDKQLNFGTKKDDGSYSFDTIAIDADADGFVSCSAYSTKIITDAPNADVTLNADEDTPAYVNGRFVIFKNITAQTDAAGHLEVVRIADDLTPSRFAASYSGESADVDFAKVLHDKVLSLNTSDAIMSAKVYDVRGNAASLTDCGKEKAEYAAKTLRQIAASGQSLKRSLMASPSGAAGVNALNSISVKNIIDGIEYGFHEAWDFVVGCAEAFWDNTLGKVIEFAIDVVGGTLRFIIKIGEDVLTFVLDTIVKIIQCAVKVLEFIGIPVTKMVKWLLSFLDIDGAVRAKDAAILCADMGVGVLKKGLINYKSTALDKMQELIDKVADWAQIDPRGYINDKPPQSKYSFSMSGPGSYMFDLIAKQGNLFSFQLPYGAPPAKLVAAGDALIAALPAGGDYGVGIITQIVNGITSSTTAASFVSGVKAFFGTLAVKVLTAVKQAIGQLFDFLAEALDWLWEILKKDITIPFLSPVLKVFGIESFSLLDLILIIPCFLANITYRLVEGRSLISEELLNQIKTTLTAQNAKTRVLSASESVASAAIPKGAPKFPSDYASLERNPIASKSYREGAFALKTVLCAVAVIETGVAVYAYYQDYITEKDKKSKNGATCARLSIVLTLTDFGISLAAGIGLYAPMNYNEYSSTRFYTGCWYAKTLLALMISSVDLYCAVKDGTDFPRMDVAKVTCNELLIIGAIASLSAESDSIGHVRDKFLDFDDKDVYFADGKSVKFDKTLQNDRDAFLIETGAFIADDIRAMIDAVMGISDILGAKLSPETQTAIVILRSLLALTYGGMVCGAAVKAL